MLTKASPAISSADSPSAAGFHAALYVTLVVMERRKGWRKYEWHREYGFGGTEELDRGEEFKEFGTKNGPAARGGRSEASARRARNSVAAKGDSSK